MFESTPKQRSTPQRQFILDYLRASLTHPTADEIFQAVRKNLASISFGTVYRNLDLLEKMGEISSIYYSKDHVRYDPIPEKHYHFICLNCDKVEDLVFQEIPDIDKQVEKTLPVKVTHHLLNFYGHCADCKKLF
jgi:Fe2+ or Zn2+ uptake regulation protein